MKPILSKNPYLMIHLFAAIIIGILCGNFLGNNLMTDQTLGVISDVDTSKIYILQSGAYYSEVSAQAALNQMDLNGLQAIIVKEYNNYYVYHDVGLEVEDLQDSILYFEEKGWDYFIKEKTLSKYLHQLSLDNDPTISGNYDFYLQSIEYYLLLLSGQKVNFSSDYIEQINDSTIDLFNQLNLLNSSIHTRVAPKYKLLVYRSFAHALM